MKNQQFIKKLIYTFCFGIILFSANSVLAATRTWDGGGATNNWSEAANWSDDTAPTSNDSVVFDATSTKNSTIDVNFSVTSFSINSGYSGAISSGTSNLTINGIFTQSDGTFTGGSGTLDINGNINLFGGTFTASSGNTFLSGVFTSQGGSFVPNGGNFIFDSDSANTSVDIVPNGVLNFDNVEINKAEGFNVFVQINDILRVNGTLTLTNGLISLGGGVIEALGNVSIAPTFDGGNGFLRLGGNATRTVTIPSPLSMPQLTVNSPNVTVNTSGSGNIAIPSILIQDAVLVTNGAANFILSSSFTQSGGAFNGGSGAMTFAGIFTQSGGTFTGGSGSLDFNGSLNISGGTFAASSGNTFLTGNLVVTGGTFQPNGGTFIFDTFFTNSTVDITPNGVLNFDNVEINKTNQGNVFVGVGDTLRTNGTLTLTEGFISAGGVIEALGNVSIAPTFNGGNGFLTFSGNTTRMVTIPSPVAMPNLTVNAPNTTVNTSGSGNIAIPSILIQDAVLVTNGAANFILSSSFTQSGGAFNGGSGAMTFAGIFTQSGGTFTGGSGSLDFNGSLNISGGTFAASSGNTFLTGNLVVTGGTFQPNGGTFIFDTFFTNSTVDITPNGVLNFDNVEINKTNQGNVFVGVGDTLRTNGTLTLTEGFISAGGVIEALGNVSIAPTFNGGNGSLAFGGANVQTFQNNGGMLPTGSWTLNKTGGTVNLLSDLDLSGGTSTFTLTEGTITTGANTVIAGTRNVTNTNGFIIGGLQRTYNSSGTRSFAVGTANGFAPVTINATAGTFGVTTTFTVRANNGTLAGASATQSLTRNWTLEPSVNGITTANLTFQYLETDLPIGSDEATFDFLRRSGTTTTNEGFSNRNTTTNIFTLNGVTQFSDWTLGTLAPTAANVMIGGRVLTDTGRGIPRARLSLTDSFGNRFATQTNPFGYYRFDNVTAGETYIISVAHKSYQFANPTQIINVSDSITDLNFIAENEITSQGIFEIGGKVLDAKGRVLPNILVEISGGSLKENLTITTDEQGRYLFDSVESGETYIFNIIDKRYVFAPKVITICEDRYDMDFLQ